MNPTSTQQRFNAALITGASSGIGAAFARALSSDTNLLLTGRNKPGLEGLATELAAPGRRIEIVPADLALPEGRSTIIEVARHFAVDLFISSAGVGIAGNFYATSSAAELSAVAVNVVAVTELLHALVPQMLALAKRQGRRCGVIVVSSRAAFGPLPGLATYGAGKAFQFRLVESMAQELKDEPLDLLALCPTYTETEFFKRAGIPNPPWWVPAETVAREGLAALGNQSVLVCRGPQEQDETRLARFRRGVRWIIRRVLPG